ncbi:tetratricopeptide (TPR) repeat protein [Streptomyces sp. SAI-208]|nr:tetratricopeptide (TPR) repeat protein [Streptomyces sp. SAI-208]
MAGQSDRFWEELSRTYRAAGAPTLEVMLAWGRASDPPVVSSTSTVSDWLSGNTVPGTASSKFFLVMVAQLERRAAERARGEGGFWTVRDAAWWEQFLTAARAERAPRSAPSPVQLPSAGAVFVGREEPMGELMGWLAPTGQHKGVPGPQRGREAAAGVMASASVLEVTGMGGVGKTALVVEAARRAVERGWFTGGVLFADLRGHSTGQDVVPEETIDAFLRTLRPREDPPSVPAEKVRRWRKLLDELAGQDKLLLIVLDNVRQAGQLAELFPCLPHRALVTSRHTHTDAIRHRIVLSPFPPAEAEQFVRLRLAEPGHGQVVVPARVAEAAHGDHVRRVAELCGHLPLALRIVVALLRAEPDRSLRERVDELEDNLLDGMEDDDTDAEGRPLAVRACFSLCYRHLTQSRARAFRLLAAAPGPDISTASAAVLLGVPLTTARLALRGLAGMHLVDRFRRGSHELAEADQDHWSMHDLIRLYADEHGRARAEEDDRDAAVGRLLGHYRTAAETATGIPVIHDKREALFVSMAHRRAEVWLEAERANVVAAATAAPASAWRVALALQLDDFFSTRRYWLELTRLARSAVDACQQGYGDREQELDAYTCLARSLSDLGHCEEAVAVLDEADSLATQLDDCARGVIAHERGMILMEAFRPTEAIASYERAIGFFHHADQPARLAMTLRHLSDVLLLHGSYEEAEKACQSALVYCRMTGDASSEAKTLESLGNAQSVLGQHEEAIISLTVATKCAAHVQDIGGEIRCLSNLGLAFCRAGEPESAFKNLYAAERLARMFIHHEIDLAVVLSRLGAALEESKKLREAYKVYAEAAGIFRELGDTRRLAHTEGTETGPAGAEP